MKVLHMSEMPDGSAEIALEMSPEELEHIVTAGFIHILNDYLKSEVDPNEVG